jgi:FAD binding domain
MITTSASTSTTPYEELAADLYGELIRPGDPGYDEARAVYNAMIDKHPAAIARCRDSVDVISCVRFGREHGLEIAVRGGGHNAAGLGVWDNALVIDLSLLRSTTVDAKNHTVRVDAGCTWRDIDHATVGFGMATPSGFLGSTGVGGLTLGGGIGYLSRRWRRQPRARRRDSLRLPGRRLGRRHRGSRPGPGQRRPDLAIGRGLLAGAAPDLGRRRLHQLHDERGPGTGQSVLPRQL